MVKKHAQVNLKKLYRESETQSSSSSDELLTELSEKEQQFLFKESTRSMKRTATKKRYLDGNACEPYRVSGVLLRSLEDGDNPVNTCKPSDWNENVCKSCAPVL